MNKIKLFLGAVAIIIVSAIAFLHPPDAKAQGVPNTFLIGVITDGATYVVAPNVASNISAQVNCSYATSFTMSVSFALQASGTAGTDIRYAVGAETTNSCTAACPGYNGMFSIPANGTTTVYFSTNIPMSSMPYYTITSISNGNTSVLTNLHIRAYVKKSI